MLHLFNNIFFAQDKFIKKAAAKGSRLIAPKKIPQ